MVLRTPVGGGIHAPEHHGESPKPGWRTPRPESGQPQLTRPRLRPAAGRHPRPRPGDFFRAHPAVPAAEEPVADNGEALPLGAAFTLREGHDVTLVSWGASVLETLQAAEQLAERGYPPK